MNTIGEMSSHDFLDPHRVYHKTWVYLKVALQEWKAKRGHDGWGHLSILTILADLKSLEMEVVDLVVDTSSTDMAFSNQ